MSRIASRLSTVKMSATMAVSNAVSELVASGVDVSNLGLGEPDFATPSHITEAVFAAISSERMLYTNPMGTLQLRQSVAAKFKRENDLDYRPAEIAVANGAKQIIFNAMMATIEPGDEVIIPAPYFVSYPDVVKVFGGKPVIVECSADNDFKLMPQQLEQVITPQTRWLMLNSPCNPSGAVYSREQLAALGAVLDKYPQVMILADEIYEHIIFDQRKFVSFVAACPQLRERTLIANGVSKTYAMTGWRVGYGAGPEDLISAMGALKSQSCTSPSAPAQIAAQAAIDGPQGEVLRFRDAFEQRRDLVVAGIQKIKGLTLATPEGAFYAYIGCADLIGKTTPKGGLLTDDIAITKYLLEEVHVAAVPGTAYGLSPFFRISTATSEDELDKALKRIASAIEKLQI